jgi:hypothetical protein
MIQALVKSVPPMHYKNPLSSQAAARKGRKDRLMAFGDVVIFLPGISGSVLSRDGKELWGTGAGSIFRAIFSGGDSIRDLELPPDALADDQFDDGITASGLVKDLHLVPGLWKIDGYSAACEYIVRELKLERGRNFIEFPYDWRLDNRRAARKLARRAHDVLKDWRKSSGNGSARLVFVAHSMGGLVARYFIECLGGWKDTAALVTFGTPYRGSLSALGFLCNGFSKGVGPLKVDFSSVLRSMDSVYQLLPTFKCIDSGGEQLGYVGDLTGLPGLDQSRARRAAEFHQEIADARDRNMADPDFLARQYQVCPVVGTFQPTWLSAKVAGGQVTLLRERNGRDDGGDGTVPRGSALPLEQNNASQGMFTEDVHGSLQNIPHVLQHLRGVLTGLKLDEYREGEVYRGDVELLAQIPRLGLLFDDIYRAGVENELVVEPAVLDNGVRRPADVTEVTGDLIDTATGYSSATIYFSRDVDGLYRGRFNAAPGSYRVRVTAAEAPLPVTESFVAINGS